MANTTVKSITIKRVPEASTPLPANNTEINQITVDRVYDNLSANTTYSYVMWAGNETRAFDTVQELMDYIGTDHFWKDAAAGYALYAGNDQRIFASLSGTGGLSGFILSSTFWG